MVCYSNRVKYNYENHSRQKYHGNKDRNEVLYKISLSN